MGVDEGDGELLLSVERDWTATSPSSTLVRSLAALENSVPETMGIVLYEYVDPDALDALVTEQTDASVSFAIEAYQIHIEDGTLSIRSHR